MVNDVRVVVISGGDDGRSSQAIHGLEAFGDLAVLHEPTRRLGTEPDTATEDEGGNEGRTELQTPSDGASVFDDDIGTKTQENTCETIMISNLAQRRDPCNRKTPCLVLTDDDPELPEHDEGTSDSGRSHLRRVDRHCSILCADTNSQDKSRSE